MKLACLLIVVCTPVAAAAPVPEPPPTGFCFSLEKLQSATTTCKENFLFAEAAKRCVEKLKAERATLGHTLAGTLESNAQKSSGAGREAFENGVGNMDSYVDSLSHLLGSAAKARNDMLLFEGYLKWPFAVEPGVIEGGKLEQAFGTNGCFTENLGKLRRKVREMDSEIQSLEQDQRDAIAMREENRARAGFAGSDSLSQAASSRAPASVAPKVAPKAKAGNSTITGPARKVVLPGAKP